MSSKPRDLAEIAIDETDELLERALEHCPTRQKRSPRSAKRCAASA